MIDAHITPRRHSSNNHRTGATKAGRSLHPHDRATVNWWTTSDLQRTLYTPCLAASVVVPGMATTVMPFSFTCHASSPTVGSLSNISVEHTQTPYGEAFVMRAIVCIRISTL